MIGEATTTWPQASAPDLRSRCAGSRGPAWRAASARAMTGSMASATASPSGPARTLPEPEVPRGVQSEVRPDLQAARGFRPLPLLANAHLQTILGHLSPAHPL